jgi:hypothetical protein
VLAPSLLQLLERLELVGTSPGGACTLASGEVNTAKQDLSPSC